MNGIHFDKFVPRFTFSGPLKRDHAWWYDGVETEWDNIYISELPAGANTDELVRGSNLVKVQVNATQANILTGGLLYNNYHSTYDGISPLVPQASTVKRNTIAWLPYVRDQQSFGGGALLDLGVGFVSIRDGYEPHGSAPYEYTPEQTEGSYFENLSGRSQRLEGTATLYLPPRQWLGRHDVKAGLDVDHIASDQRQTRTAVSYYREGTAPGVPGRSSGRARLRRRRRSRCTTAKLAHTFRTGGSLGRDGWWSRGCDLTGTRLCGSHLWRRGWQ